LVLDSRITKIVESMKNEKYRIIEGTEEISVFKLETRTVELYKKKLTRMG
jgi:hypothetical protein